MTNWGAQFGGVPENNRGEPETSKENWGAQFGGVSEEVQQKKKKAMPLWENVKESAKDALRQTAQIPRNIIAGMGDVADLPIAAADYGLKKAGLKSEDSGTVYPGQAAANLIDTATMGYTKPQTPRERAFEAGTRAIASVPAGAGLGNVLQGVKMVSKLGRGLQKINPTDPTSLAGVGAGALAGHAYNESNPGDLVGTLGTGIAGDMATRTALGLVNKKKLTGDLQRYLANSLKINPKNAEAFNAMGVSPTLGQISDHPVVKLSENAIKELSPTSGLRNTINKQYEQMRDIVGPAAQMHAPTAQQAGSSIQGHLKDYGREISKQTGKLKDKWEKKLEKVSANNLVDVGDALGYYKRMEKGLGNTAKDLLKSGPMGQAHDNLVASAKHGKVTVPEMELYRSALFDEIQGLKPKSNERRLAQGFYKSLTNDMEDYMLKHGVLDDWKKYNAFYSQYAKTHKPHLVASEKIPEDYANKIFVKAQSGARGKIDVPLLNTIYTSQPKTAQNETMNSIFQAMGENGGAFDIHKFAKNFKSQPKEAQDILLKPHSKPQQEKIKAIIDSVGVNKELASFGNPSRTGYMSAALKAAPLLGIGAYHTATGEGLNQAEIGAILGLVGLSAGSKAFSNPRVVNWMYRGTKIKTPEAMKHHISGIKGILGRPFYQQLMQTLREHRED